MGLLKNTTSCMKGASAAINRGCVIVKKRHKPHERRERSNKQGLGTRWFSACLYLLFAATGLSQPAPCACFLRPSGSFNSPQFRALILSLVCALALGAAPARAANGALTVDMAFPDRTVVIYWRNPQIYAGQMLDAYRGGERVGRIMVTEVTAYYVKGKVVEGAALAGDIAVPPMTAAATPPADARARGNMPPDGVERAAPNPVPDDQDRLVKKPIEEQEIVLRPQDRPRGPKPDSTPVVDLGDTGAADRQPESVAPPEKKSPGFLPDISPNVVYGLGGGMYNPAGSFLTGESGSVSLGSFYKIAGKYEGSILYSVITPSYEIRSAQNGAVLTQKVEMTRLHLSLAQLPKPGLLPSLSLGAGYTFTFFDYEICGASCAGVTGRAHGPHILARTRVRAPVKLIAEARYQWDLDTDLDGLDTSGFEVNLLFPFEL